MIEKQAEAAFAELISVTFQIVAPKLINDHDDDQLRTCIVGRCKTAASDVQADQQCKAASQESH